MFKMKKNPSFWTTVEAALEGEEKQAFEARFQIKSISEMEQFDLGQADQLKKLLEEVTVEFRGFEIEEQPDAPFRDCLKLALDYAHIRNAMLRAYVAGATGAIRGN